MYSTTYYTVTHYISGTFDLCIMLSFLLSIMCITAMAYNSFISRTLGSGMVLQRDVPSMMYGHTYNPKSGISIQFNDQSYYTTSAARASVDGGYYWEATLPSMKGSKERYVIYIKSSNGEMVVLDNVVFGDVFLCADQDGMVLPTSNSLNTTGEWKDDDDFSFIRIFDVGQDISMPQSIEPLDDLYSVHISWIEGPSRDSYGSMGLQSFSGLCWRFATHVYTVSLHSLVPVGVISSRWGGTSIEDWAPLSVSEGCRPLSDEQSQRSILPPPPPVNVVAAAVVPADQQSTLFQRTRYGVLYNNMIAPLHRLELKAAVWYQGASNVHNKEQYPCLQDRMVRAWRALFGEQLPFMYVQLPSWNNGGTDELASMRLYQLSALSLIDNAAMITASDLPAPMGADDHLTEEVSRRLYLAATSTVYQTHMPYLGPILDRTQLFRDPYFGWSARFFFTEESCGSSLSLRAPQHCPRHDTEVCGHVFLLYRNEIGTAGASSPLRKVLSSVRLAGPTSIEVIPTKDLGADAVPVKLSYCQGDYPLLTIYNSLGIPLMPLVLDIESTGQQ